MEQAVRETSTRAPFVEPCALSARPHRWTIDARTRAHIDWTRCALLEAADEFMAFTPIDMRRTMMEAIFYIDAILPRLVGRADRQQLLLARMLVSSALDSHPALSLDAIAAELMEACRLLLTGSDYTDGNAPEDLIYGRA